MEPSPQSSRTSFPLADFLSLPGRDRAARLVGPFYLPQPLGATVDANRYLTWTWENPSKLHEPPSTLCFDFAKLADGGMSRRREDSGAFNQVHIFQSFHGSSSFPAMTTANTMASRWSWLWIHHGRAGGRRAGGRAGRVGAMGVVAFTARPA